MSETVTTVRVKSNAPWILGIVGVFLTILHGACAYACTVAKGAATVLGPNGSEDAAKQEMTSSLAVAGIAIAIMLACFALTFFGKSKFSKITGMLLILGSIVITILSFVHLSVPGLAAACVYLAAGITSIGNAKKPLAA